MTNQEPEELRFACFSGGCFWCIVPAFADLDGVLSVTAGYSGGQTEAPTYGQVKSQETGHRESVRIEYDPQKVTYGDLLDCFLAQVDPFDGEGQFIDRGFSYTLAVYPSSPEEAEEAKRKIRALEERAGRPVRIAVEPFQTFWPAEEEHQDFYLKNPEKFEEEMISSGRRTPPPEGNADSRKL
ncbi:MAG: peptide-methionine (S)-S-oxide reductase MsrA [Clostridia bacterium]|nr:peptide-methionine (S)-S-oxide reductase MsrA [Clostridia bacterium]